MADDWSEEVLQATIEEVERLRLLFTTMSPLLKLIERREWIKEEMKRFEQRASDPDRFKGSSARLLQEAKFRKVMSKVHDSHSHTMARRMSEPVTDWRASDVGVSTAHRVSLREAARVDGRAGLVSAVQRRELHRSDRAREGEPSLGPAASAPRITL